MRPTAVGHCDYCTAVVNRHWANCLVCHAPLTTMPLCEKVNPITAALPIPTIQAGSQITWQRADLTMQAGAIDYLYVDDAGVRWAFVTIGESWAAVNLKFATLVEEGGQN